MRNSLSQLALSNLLDIGVEQIAYTVKHRHALTGHITYLLQLMPPNVPSSKCRLIEI